MATAEAVKSRRQAAAVTMDVRRRLFPLCPVLPDLRREIKTVVMTVIVVEVVTAERRTPNGTGADTGVGTIEGLVVGREGEAGAEIVDAASLLMENRGRGIP